MEAAIVLDRSNLMVPLSSERFLAKAHLRDADMIVLDLEDGVADNSKEAARARLATAVPNVRRGGARVRVRVNSEPQLLALDLDAAVREGVDVIGLAKVRDAGQVREVSAEIGRLEAERGLEAGSVDLYASIESLAALSQVNDIARADPRLRTLSLGKEDIAAECGFEPTAESLHFPMQLVLYAARAAGIAMYGYLGSVADYTDLDSFRHMLARSRRLGFVGGTAIHPDQVPLLNEAFGVSENERRMAAEIVALADAEFAKGNGAFAYRGRMIDKPVVARHAATLARHAAIARREAQHAAALAAQPT